MKKIVLSTIATLLVSAFVLAQQASFNIYKLEYGTYDATNDNYKLNQNSQYVGMKLTYQNATFLINDEAKSVYMVKEVVDNSDKECGIYEGEDEKDRDVLIILCAKPNTGTFTVIYKHAYYITYYITDENKIN